MHIWLFKILLLTLQVLGPVTASRLGLTQRSVFSDDTGTLPRKFGRFVTLRGFKNSHLNAKFAESLDPQSQIAGHHTFWSSADKGGSFIYFCSLNKQWIIAPNVFFAKVREQRACTATASLGQVDLDNGVGSGTKWSSTGVSELVNERLVAAPKAGITDVAFACGAFDDVGSCPKDRCAWDATHKQCHARWGILRLGTPMTMYDVAQGELGTCYFLASLAALAHRHPDVLESRFVHRERWTGQHPAYTVSFLMDGELTLVSVDEAVPVSPRSGKPAFVGFSGTHMFWPVVFEKAWAKVYGNFKAIEGGTPAEALKALSQAPVYLLKHAGLLNQDFDAQDVDDLWRGVLDATQKGFAMTSCTNSNTTNGIAKSHAYALIGAKELVIGGGKRKVVEMYNPWNKNNYEGQMPNTDHGVGNFFMTIEEYANAFTHTIVAEIQRGYVVSSHPFPLQARKGKAVVKFRMPSSKPFTIMLAWPNPRLFTKAGCTPLLPSVKLGIGQAASAPEIKDDSDKCARLMSEKPHRCDNSYYKATCRRTCNDLTSRTESFALPSTGAGAGHGTQILEHNIGVSNIRAALPGGQGEYTVNVDVDFPSAHGKLLNKLTLVVYADKQVSFQDAGSSLIEEELNDDISTDVLPEQCLKLYKRLSTLNNWEQIKRNGNDKVFPEVFSSIAAPGDKCGDAAQGINEDCSRYDNWATFHEIMMGQVDDMSTALIPVKK